MDELRGPPIWETPAYKHHKKHAPWHGQGEHTWDKTILAEQSPHQLPCHNNTWQDALPFATLLLQGWSVKITSYNAGKIIHYICCWGHYQALNRWTSCGPTKAHLPIEGDVSSGENEARLADHMTWFNYVHDIYRRIHDTGDKGMENLQTWMNVKHIALERCSAISRL